MPKQQILPTWVALNNANFTSPTGLTDLRTGQPFEAGGLSLGDYFDVTEQEANAASDRTIGLCHWGRYRLVQVDSGATAANVQTGALGYAAVGKFVENIVVTNAGTGGTPGTYNIPADISSGGGRGAVIQIVVGGAGTIASASVVQGGFNYTSQPTFNIGLAATGVAGAVISAVLNSTPNIVTSYDQNAQLLPNPGPRVVIFLNSITPGNFGFIQELGVAVVLAQGGGAIQPGLYVVPTANGSGMGVVSPSGGFNSGTFGQFVDTVPAAALNSQLRLVKVYMNLAGVFQD